MLPDCPRLRTKFPQNFTPSADETINLDLVEPTWPELNSKLSKVSASPLCKSKLLQIIQNDFFIPECETRRQICPVVMQCLHEIGPHSALQETRQASQDFAAKYPPHSTAPATGIRNLHYRTGEDKIDYYDLHRVDEHIR